MVLLCCGGSDVMVAWRIQWRWSGCDASKAEPMVAVGQSGCDAADEVDPMVAAWMCGGGLAERM